LLSVALPINVAPSRNCTVPVAVAGVTFAVNVTVCPAVEEPAGTADSVVVELAGFTV
jgi:hypothetical protein